MAEKEKKVRRTLIGGQALMEGVMMRGRTAMAMAVRDDAGEIRLETERLKGARWYNKVPVIRGVAAFVSSLVTGVSTLMKSAEVSTPDEEMPGKGAMTFAVVLGVVLAVGLFILLPSGVTWVFERFCGLENILAISLIEGLVRLAIFIGYLLLVSRMRDIRRTFMYHGAEHRTINCYEKGLEMTVENVQKCSTRHNRCGTTFLFFVMVVSIVVFALTNWIFSFFGSWSANVFVRILLRLALLPLVAGLSYELLRGLALMPDNAFTNVLRAPGLALQRLTTYPPEDEMAEVALKSFLAVLEMDENPQIETVTFDKIPVAVLREGIAARLPETAEACEVDWIVSEVTGIKRSALSGIKSVSVKVRDRAYAMAGQRRAGEPLDYITGHTDFYGIHIKVGPGVLIPRPETELLAERAVNEVNKRTAGGAPCAVLDLCTGSGCIARVLAEKTSAAVTAADVSEEALFFARDNLAGRAEVVPSDMFAALSGRTYDVIVCNPPYIATAELPTLAEEVRREPQIALDGGADGLDFYRRLAAEAPAHLSDGGALLMEIGYDQGERVPALFGGGEVYKDYAGHDRIVIVRKDRKDGTDES